MAWFLREVLQESDADRGLQSNYLRYFKLYSDSGQTMGPLAASDYVGLPEIGDAYTNPFDGQTDETSFCYSIRPEILEGADGLASAWGISVLYQSPQSGGGGGGDAPDQEPPVVEYKTTQYIRVMQKGLYFGAYRQNDGSAVDAADPKGNATNPKPRPVLTTAGEQYEDLPEYDSAGIQLTWSRKVLPANWQAATVITWANAVNTDTFLGLPAYTWRVIDIQAAQEWLPPNPAGGAGQPLQLYYNVTWVLEYKSIGHFVEPMDFGNLYFDSPGGIEPVVNVDTTTGHKAPLHLDGKGLKLSQADQNAGKYVFLRYLPSEWPRKAFSTIPGGPIVP